MKIENKNIVQRESIKIGQVRLTRVKLYNSVDKKTRIVWTYSETRQVLRDVIAVYMEKKYNKHNRKKSVIH
jgi:hypothetical protein